MIRIQTSPGRGRADAAVRVLSVALLATAGGLLIHACSPDIQGPPNAIQPVDPLPESAPFGTQAFAFDLGISLAAPGGGAAAVTDTALSTNVIPGGTLLTLFAFVTDAPANNGNGTGTPLDPEAPADANGASDVFLSVLDSNGQLKDTALVSQRAAGGPAAGNGVSRRPSVAFLANAGFQPGNPQATNPAGFVHVAFESTASNLIAAGDTNARSDVFRVVLALNVDQDPATGAVRAGALNLRFLDNTAAAAFRPLRASVSPTGVQGSGNATAPAISADANVVAFVAEDALLAGDTNGLADVFARILNPATTVLVSRRNGGGFPAGGASGNPRLAGDRGEVVLFESAATNLLATDGNGVQDVFWARLAATTGTITNLRRASVRTGGVEATGGASRNGSVFPLDLIGDDVLVAFESDKTDLVAARPPNTTTTVYLFDSRGTGTTTLLAQRLGPDGATLGTAQGGAQPADSFRPALNATGTAVVFDTRADNLDRLRPADTNGVADVVLADLTFFFRAGILRHHRLSVASNGADGNGASTAVGFAGFAGTATARVASNGLPVAFTARIAAKFRNDRCVLCHGYNATPSTRGLLGANHIGIEQCSCHQADASIGVPCWHAPPPQFDLRGKTDQQLCDMAKTDVFVQGVGSNCAATATLTPFQHFNTDDKITWAANSGRVPFTTTPRALLPGGRAQLLAEVDAWIEGGFQCDDIAAAAAGEVLWFQTAATNLGAAGTGLLIAFPTRTAVERVSKTDGFPPAGGRQVRAASRNGHITRDDRFVVFESDAALDVNDRNGATDVYVRDLFLGRTLLVSHAAGSIASANGASRAPRACVDQTGRLHVAFESLASNLVAGFADRNGSNRSDVFEADFTTFDGSDLRTVAVQLVSRATAAATTGGNGASEAPDIAAGGPVFVAFHSTATDLLAGFADGNGAVQPDVFRAQIGGSTAVMSQNTAGTAGGNGGSRAARLSDDGSIVVFESAATDLVPGFVDQNGTGPDVYRLAIGGAGMQLVSVATAGGSTGGTGDSSRPAVSGDGLFVAFQSLASDLVAGFVDGNGALAPDVFLRDVAGAQTRLMSAATAGLLNGGNGASTAPALTTDGSAVGFDSLATDLLAMTDANGAAAGDVFLRDTAGNTTRILSVARGSSSQTAAAASTAVGLGRKGGRVVFQSVAGDLIETGADTNALADVFASR